MPRNTYNRHAAINPSSTGFKRRARKSRPTTNNIERTPFNAYGVVLSSCVQATSISILDRRHVINNSSLRYDWDDATLDAACDLERADYERILDHASADMLDLAAKARVLIDDLGFDDRNQPMQYRNDRLLRDVLYEITSLALQDAP